MKKENKRESKKRNKVNRKKRRKKTSTQQEWHVFWVKKEKLKKVRAHRKRERARADRKKRDKTRRECAKQWGKIKQLEKRRDDQKKRRKQVKKTRIKKDIKKQKEKRKEKTWKKWNEMTKKWKQTAWCNGWPAADVRVTATTEQLSTKDEKKRWKEFCCEMEYRSLFCFWKFQQQIANPKQRPQHQRAETESFFLVQQKEDIVFSDMFRKKRVFLHTENGQKKGKYWVKAEISEKTLHKKKVKEKRMQWRRDDIDRGLRPSRRSHNTILAKHAIWFFTKLSEGMWWVVMCTTPVAYNGIYSL